MAKRQRSDAERRLRQCERLSRVLRILRLIMGPGRWDAKGLARELECSERTVYRIMQTLSMAGVPWYYDDSSQAYRVRAGFKFPGLPVGKSSESSIEPTTVTELVSLTQRIVQQGDEFLSSLRQFCNRLQSATSPD